MAGSPVSGGSHFLLELSWGRLCLQKQCLVGHLASHCFMQWSRSAVWGAQAQRAPWALLPVTRCAGLAPAPCRLPEQGLAGRACPAPQPGTPAQPLASPWGWAEARLGCGLGSGRAVAGQGWGEPVASPAVALHGLTAPGADVGSQAMAELCGARPLGPWHSSEFDFWDWLARERSSL